MFGARDILGWRYALGPTCIGVLAAVATLAVAHKLSQPLAITLAFLPLLLFFILQNTFFLAVLFVSFAYFRIHEAYPPLAQLGLTGLLGASVVGGLLWRGLLINGNAPKGQGDLKVLSLITAGLAIVFTAMAGGASGFTSAGGLAFGSAGLVAFACALGLWHQMLGRASPEGWPPAMNYFVLFAIVASVGVALSPYPSVAYAHWVNIYWKICVVVFAIAWLAQSVTDFTRAIYIILLTGIAIGAVAIYNKIYGIDLVEGTRVSIGLMLHAPKDSILGPDPSKNYASSLGDPNELAMVLLFPLGFACALIYYQPNRVLVGLAIVAIIVLLLAIIFTRSRGGLLGVMAVGGIIGLRVVRSKSLLIGAGGVVAVALFLAMGLGERSVLNTSGEVEESSMGRIWAWGAALLMLLRFPLNGVGMSAFQEGHLDYHIVLTGFNKEAHSTWFGIIGETGLPGTVLFALMVYHAIMTSWHCVRKLDAMGADLRLRAVALGLVGGLAGFCVSGSFLTHGFTWPLYMQLAFSVALWRLVRREELRLAQDSPHPAEKAWWSVQPLRDGRRKRHPRSAAS